MKTFAVLAWFCGLALMGCGDNNDEAAGSEVAAWCTRHITSVPGDDLLRNTLDPTAFDNIVEAAIEETGLRANGPDAIPAGVRDTYSELQELWKTVKGRVDTGERVNDAWAGSDTESQWLELTFQVYATPVAECPTNFSPAVRSFVPSEFLTFPDKIGYTPVATTTTP
jgi:hypothetical protein